MALWPYSISSELIFEYNNICSEQIKKKNKSRILIQSLILIKLVVNSECLCWGWCSGFLLVCVWDWLKRLIHFCLNDLAEWFYLVSLNVVNWLITRVFCPLVLTMILSKTSLFLLYCVVRNMSVSVLNDRNTFFLGQSSIFRYRDLMDRLTWPADLRSKKVSGVPKLSVDLLSSILPVLTD